MSEGTSLEDIETGNVAHSADSDVMNEILKDMNGMTPEPPAASMYELPRALPPMTQQPLQQPVVPQHYEPMMQPMQQPPPFMDMHMPMPMSQHYQPMEPPQPQHVAAAPVISLKRNAWSQIFDRSLQPLFVAFLVVVLSLPAAHTWLAKHLKWAYHVGGALSWTGIVLQAAVAGLVFAGFQYVMENSS